MPYKSVKFWKFESAGNDFIMIDNRSGFFRLTQKEIEQMCCRRFGIGADGMILLERHDTLDFLMRYFNSDGMVSTFCGNGGRAICGFARILRFPGKDFEFEAADGIHHATIEPLSNFRWTVILSMKDIEVDNRSVINSGSPHHMVYADDIANMDVITPGREIRNSPKFAPGGCNVNFIMAMDQKLYVRTYERGVEDETFSCGTGVTASAVFHHLDDPDGHYKTLINTRGGSLEVSFRKTGTTFTDIVLEGITTLVFRGEYLIEETSHL